MHPPAGGGTVAGPRPIAPPGGFKRPAPPRVPMNVDVPAPGLGTSGNDDPETCADTVATAIETGYRHVDTAQMYDNEAAVGEGVRRADVPREEVFVATKVHPENLAPDDVRATARESLDRLGLEYVDLLYVHWPVDAYDAPATLPAFDEVREAGLTRHVGVSNFTPELLDEARELLDAPVVAHQVECHPLLQQDDLRRYAREQDHALVAYAPLLRGDAGDVDALAAVAEKHGVTPHQVSLAWLLGLENVVPIPKGTGDHVAENWAARDVDLDDADRERIAAVDREERLLDPDRAAWNR
jgi:2,5-diketo-D-gluconate reductase B